MVAICPGKERIIVTRLRSTRRRPRRMERRRRRYKSPGGHAQPTAIPKAQPVDVAIDVAAARLLPIEQEEVSGVKGTILLADHLNADLTIPAKELQGSRVQAIDRHTGRSKGSIGQLVQTVALDHNFVAPRSCSQGAWSSGKARRQASRRAPLAHRRGVQHQSAQQVLKDRRGRVRRSRRREVAPARKDNLDNQALHQHQLTAHRMVLHGMYGHARQAMVAHPLWFSQLDGSVGVQSIPGIENGIRSVFVGPPGRPPEVHIPRLAIEQGNGLRVNRMIQAQPRLLHLQDLQ